MCTAVMRFDRLHLRFFTCFFTTCISNHAMRLTHIWIRIAFRLSPRKLFCTKVVLIVGTVYLLNVIQKLFAWFSIAVLVDERGERLVELMERLDS